MTISGSTHNPNCRPSARTPSTRGAAPAARRLRRRTSLPGPRRRSAGGGTTRRPARTVPRRPRRRPAPVPAACRGRGRSTRPPRCSRRPGAVTPVVRAGAQVLVEARRDPVQTGVGPGPEHPRGAVALAGSPGAEHPRRQEQFPPDHASLVPVSSRSTTERWFPLKAVCCAQTSPRRTRNPRCRRRGRAGRPVRCAPAVLAHVGPEGERTALGDAFLGPPAPRSNTSVATTGTGRLRRGRHLVAVGAGVRHRRTVAQEPEGRSFQFEDQPRPAVPSAQSTCRRPPPALPVSTHGGRDEARRPGGAGPVTAQPGRSAPPPGRLRQQPRGWGTSRSLLERAGRPEATRSSSWRSERSPRSAPQWTTTGTEVEDVDDQAHTRGPQVQGPPRHGAGPGGRGAVGRGEGGGVVLGHGGSVGTSAWWTGRVSTLKLPRRQSRARHVSERVKFRK